MILTITLNPALDVTGVVSELVPNEKAYVSDEIRLAGGNGINAARIAHRLGGKVLASGFLGGSTGDELKGYLDEEKIPQHFILIQGRTRTNVTISLKKGHEQTRLSFPGPKIKKSELKSLKDLIRHLKPSLLVIGGSLPGGVEAAFICSLIHEARLVGIETFVDVPGKILKEVIGTHPFFIKPNLTEFQEMAGTKVSKIADVIKVARKLNPLIPLQCISSVEGGALVVTPEEAWFGKTPKLKIMSTVGAGDSMVGAMAYCFARRGKPDFEKMLRLGLAASSATLSNPGLTMGSRSSIKYFEPKIMIQKID